MSTLKGNAISVTPQDVFTSAAVQATDLGAIASTGDGRYFRYVLAGGTSLVPGKLQQSSAQDTTNLNPSGGLSVLAAAIGATQVTISSSITLTANQLAGGYLGVNVTPGQGYTYRIKGNSAVSSAANCVVTLEDPIQVALTTSSKIVLTASPFNSVIVNPTTATGSPVGVAVYPITNAQYGWIQSHGVVCCLTDAGTTVGLGYKPSTNTAGAVMSMAATGALVGYAINTGVTTEYDNIFLTID